MTDARTRQLARHAAQGDLQAEVALLRERVRAQDDSREPWGCPHCERRVERVEMLCSTCQGSQLNPKALAAAIPRPCPHCETGRVDWPWLQPVGGYVEGRPGGQGRGAPTSDRGRLSLAAYAGSEAARGLVPCPPLFGMPCRTGWHSRKGDARSLEPCTNCNKAFTFDRWLSGLSRWPGALLCASLAAGWGVLPGWRERTHAGGRRCRQVGTSAECQLVRRALTAASDHLVCGCSRSREVWLEAGGEPGALPSWCVVYGVPRDYSIQAAAQILTEPVTRKLICEALVTWALG